MELITWNTQWCRGIDGAVRPERIIEVARDMADFDVLCLQEVAQGFDGLPGGPGDQPAQLAALLPGYCTFFGPAVDDRPGDGRAQRFGNLVATRLPVVHVQHHPLPWPADPEANSMPRMCTVVTLRHPAQGALRVMTTHLEYESATQRLAQARALHDLHAEACSHAANPPKAEENDPSPSRRRTHTVHAVLCGDFNSPPGGPEGAAIQAAFAAERRLHDAWPLVHGSATHAPTFGLVDHTYEPAPVAFDFVFVSDTLRDRVGDIRVESETRASDHQPVLIRFRA